MEPRACYGRRYIDIRYDFNFKQVFGREEGKDLRTDLLNSLFEGRKTFKDVRLGPTERQGIEKTSRKARFDLQCIGDNSEQILIEMQRGRQEGFFSRLEFYGIRMGSEQVPAGKEGDDFLMPEIYAIAIRNFDIWQGMELPVELQNEYINSYDLRHVKTCHEYPMKLELMLVELRKFNKQADELESRADKWLYLFNNLHLLTEPIFTDDPIFQKLFQLTEYNNLTREDRKMLIDYERDERNRAKVLRKEGMEAGLAKGRQEGVNHAKRSIVRMLVQATDFDDRKIASLTGVDEVFVRDLRAET